jgi:hypothetical protein
MIVKTALLKYFAYWIYFGDIDLLSSRDSFEKICPKRQPNDSRRI